MRRDSSRLRALAIPSSARVMMALTEIRFARIRGAPNNAPADQRRGAPKCRRDLNADRERGTLSPYSTKPVYVALTLACSALPSSRKWLGEQFEQRDLKRVADSQQHDIRRIRLSEFYPP